MDYFEKANAVTLSVLETIVPRQGVDAAESFAAIRGAVEAALRETARQATITALEATLQRRACGYECVGPVAVLELLRKAREGVFWTIRKQTTRGRRLRGSVAATPRGVRESRLKRDAIAKAQQAAVDALDVAQAKLTERFDELKEKLSEVSALLGSPRAEEREEGIKALSEACDLECELLNDTVACSGYAQALGIEDELSDYDENKDQTA